MENPKFNSKEELLDYIAKGNKSFEDYSNKLLEHLTALDKDTLKFLSKYVPSIDNNSTMALLESNEKAKTIDLGQLQIVVNFEALNAIPSVHELFDEVTLSELTGQRTKDLKKKKYNKATSLGMISGLFNTIAQNNVLFVPTMQSKSDLFDKAVTTAYSLNSDILNCFTRAVGRSDNDVYVLPDYMGKSVKVQTEVIEKLDEFDDNHLVKLIDDIAPLSGLNQRIPMVDTFARKDVMLVKKDDELAASFAEQHMGILNLTRLFLSLDYSQEQLIHLDEIINTLTNDKIDCYIAVCPTDTALELKIECEVSFVSHTEAYHSLTKNLDDNMKQFADGIMQVKFFDWTAGTQGEVVENPQDDNECYYTSSVEVSKEMAVAFFETIQGYDKGFVDRMEAYSKQMFLAYQSAMSISQNADCLTEDYINTPLATLHNKFNTREVGFNAQRYRFAVPIYYKEDSQRVGGQVDTEAMQKVDNLKMFNPYFIKVN